MKSAAGLPAILLVISLFLIVNPAVSMDETVPVAQVQTIVMAAPLQTNPSLVVEKPEYSINQPPIAYFTTMPGGGPAPLTVEFDAGDSYDPDGKIARYQWNFGDGSSGEGVRTSHTFEKAGCYQVTLTVTDDQKATGSAAATICAATAGKPPVAFFTATPETGPAPLTVEFDAGDSYDPDGKKLAYSWDFGDGTGGEGVHTTHQYGSGGCYIATLTVTDGDGLQTAAEREVCAAIGNAAAGNIPPVALFTAAAGPGEGTLSVEFDAGLSHDPDGSIIGYEWDYGDGNRGEGVGTSHSYHEEGCYIVTLTVTDSGQLQGMQEQRICISLPALPAVPVSTTLSPVQDESPQTTTATTSTTQSNAVPSPDATAPPATPPVNDVPFAILLLMAAVIAGVAGYGILAKPKPRLTPEKWKVPCDGESTIPIKVQVVNAFGIPKKVKEDTSVHLTTTAGKIDDVVIPAGNDFIEAILTSSLESGLVSVTGEYGKRNTEVEVEFECFETGLELSIDPEKISADGTSQALVKIMVKNTKGKYIGALKGRTVTLSITSGSITSLVIIPPRILEGRAVITAGTEPGKAQIRASTGLHLKGDAEIEFV